MAVFHKTHFTKCYLWQVTAVFDNTLNHVTNLKEQYNIWQHTTTFHKIWQHSSVVFNVKCFGGCILLTLASMFIASLCFGANLETVIGKSRPERGHTKLIDQLTAKLFFKTGSSINFTLNDVLVFLFYNHGDCFSRGSFSSSLVTLVIFIHPPFPWVDTNLCYLLNFDLQLQPTKQVPFIPISSFCIWKVSVNQICC